MVMHASVINNKQIPIIKMKKTNKCFKCVWEWDNRRKSENDKCSLKLALFWIG